MTAHDLDDVVVGVACPVGHVATTGQPFRTGDFRDVKTAGAVLSWPRHGGHVLAKADDCTLLFFEDRDGALCFSAVVPGRAVLKDAIRHGWLGCSINATVLGGAGHNVVGAVFEVSLLFRDGRFGLDRPRFPTTGVWLISQGEAAVPDNVRGAFIKAAASITPSRTRSRPPQPSALPRQPAAAPRRTPRTLSGARVPAHMLARVRAAQARFLPPDDMLMAMASHGAIMDAKTAAIMASRSDTKGNWHSSHRRGR